MRSHLALLGAVTLAAGALGGPAFATGAADKGRTVVADSVVSPGRSLGAAPAGAVEHFIVTFALRDQAGAEAFVRAVSDPTSPQHGKFLSPAQFTERFAASKPDIDKAVAWLRSQGLQTGAVPASRSYVQVSGSVAQVNKAFGTRMQRYLRNGHVVSAPARSVTVPSSVSGVVAGVIGLDQSRILHTTNTHTDEPTAQRSAAAKTLSALGARPNATSGASDACSSYYGQYHLPNIPNAASPLKGVQPGSLCGYTPQQVRAARGMTASNTGQGMKVGITLWCNDPRIEADTNKWANTLGFQPLRTGQYKVIEPDLGYNPLYCDNQGSGGVNAEQALDVQSIHGAAPDANIIYSAASAPLDNALITSMYKLVNGNQVDAISDSWGGSESNDPITNGAYSRLFMQAAAQGISVLFSSGDYGDNTNGDQSTTAPSADYPAANPWVTAVGGTSLATGDASGSKVLFEQAWNTSSDLQQNDAWSGWQYRYGGGGGVSQYHAEPYYQQGVVPTQFTGADPHRVYPDMAGIGDPYTGYLIGFHDATTGNNFSLEKIGGTSWSSPWTAGTLALVGKRVGFLNPAIYGPGHAGLTDIKGNAMTHGFEYKTSGTIATVGINSQQVQDQTLVSQPGYDDMTGFGVPASTSAFVNALR
ncbi:MAG TPA: S53 family peptidase [Flexivirga sp.]|uniref:S53 family peptidase n=1 Tax=Flexivirga sp. TaxID=1962927 RepID=UPI002D013292|nr:S53 family peptidase [Flexivirga sp.]HWC23762.1 S53 family peptidase [Flexivirga sp.]